MSGGVGCRVAGLAETITNSVKLKLKLRLSLAKSPEIIKSLTFPKNQAFLAYLSKGGGVYPNLSEYAPVVPGELSFI